MSDSSAVKFLRSWSIYHTDEELKMNIAEKEREIREMKDELQRREAELLQQVVPFKVGSTVAWRGAKYRVLRVTGTAHDWAVYFRRIGKLDRLVGREIYLTKDQYPVIV